MKSNTPQNQKSGLSKIKTFIMEADILLVSLIPLLSAFTLLIAIALFFNNVLVTKIPIYYSSKLIGAFFIFSSAVGLLYIIRRECPGPLGKPIKDIYAIFSGTILFFSFLALESCSCFQFFGNSRWALFSM
jgi:hypothetical protein